MVVAEELGLSLEGWVMGQAHGRRAPPPPNADKAFPGGAVSGGGEGRVVGCLRQPPPAMTP